MGDEVRLEEGPRHVPGVARGGVGAGRVHRRAAGGFEVGARLRGGTKRRTAVEDRRAGDAEGGQSGCVIVRLPAGEVGVGDRLEPRAADLGRAESDRGRSGDGERHRGAAREQAERRRTGH